MRKGVSLKYAAKTQSGSRADRSEEPRRLLTSTLGVAGIMSYRSVSSLNCAVAFVGAARVTYRSRLPARLAFLASDATNIGAGLGCLFGLLGPKGQIPSELLPTLLFSGPKKAALFPAAELRRWAS